MAYKQKRIDSALKRAALYARVSTEEQAMHGVSLDAQRERLLTYAKENDLTVVDVYVDEGISARKRYTARPAFTKMLEDVKAKKIDVVLFIKLDRWFRNIADYYEVQAILDKYKVQWIATEEDYDTTTANGRLALNIKLAIAQDESDRTSERIKFVFQNMVKEGRVISGRTPKGFKIVDKRVVLDEPMVPLVKDAFRKIIDCRGSREACRYIQDTYGINMDPKSFKHMIACTWYIGEAYGIKDWCPRIIDNDTFHRANEIINTRAERYDYTRTDRVYLFTGLLFCQKCGRRMATYACRNTRKDGSQQTFIYYRCTRHLLRQCDMTKQINQDKLEKWLLDNLLIEADKHNMEIMHNGKRAPKKSIDRQKVMAKIEKLKDLYINDLIPKEMYEKDYLMLSSLLNEAEKQESAEEKRLIDVKQYKDLLAAYNTLDLESRKAFWSRVINKIVVTETGDYIVTLNQL